MILSHKAFNLPLQKPSSRHTVAVLASEFSYTFFFLAISTDTGKGMLLIR